MNDVIISVEHLSKKYRLGEIGATSLRDAAERLWKKVGRGLTRTHADDLSACGMSGQKNALLPQHVVAASPCGSVANPSDDSSELWALKDVSFEVKRYSGPRRHVLKRC